MKKLLFGMSALVLLFASCNGNDDEASSGEGIVLLKKTIENGPDGQYISTATYNDTKIVKISTSDSETIDFTYTGDNITKMVWKADGDIEQEDQYTYNSGGNLATHITLDIDMSWGSKEVFTYNSDNTVTVQTFSGDLVSQTVAGESYTITFVNGEVSQIVRGGNTTTYTYDTKNNPFKNVTGYGKISFVDSGASGIMHNILTETSSDGDDTVYTYTYNSKDFPATATETWDGDVYTTQFQYN